MENDNEDVRRTRRRTRDRGPYGRNAVRACCASVRPGGIELTLVSRKYRCASTTAVDGGVGGTHSVSTTHCRVMSVAIAALMRHSRATVVVSEIYTMYLLLTKATSDRLPYAVRLRERSAVVFGENKRDLRAGEITR